MGRENLPGEQGLLMGRLKGVILLLHTSLSQLVRVLEHHLLAFSPAASFPSTQAARAPRVRQFGLRTAGALSSSTA